MKPLIIMLCCITVSLCTFIIDRGLTQRAEIELRTAAKLDEVSKRSDRTAAELAKQVEALKARAQGTATGAK